VSERWAMLLTRERVSEIARVIECMWEIERRRRRKKKRKREIERGELTPCCSFTQLLRLRTPPSFFGFFPLTIYFVFAFVLFCFCSWERREECGGSFIYIIHRCCTEFKQLMINYISLPIVTQYFLLYSTLIIHQS
jgi:hypothetical protein